MPSDEAIKASREGKITLGGCSIPIGGPIWRCDECDHEGGKLRIGD
jgi:hypothetical protein